MNIQEFFIVLIHILILKLKNPKLRIDTKLKELIDFSKLSLLLGSYNRKNNKKFYFKFTNKVSNNLKK